MMDNSITQIGVTDWRDIHQPFGIKDKDRARHIYCLGKSGCGKSTLLQNMAIADIQKGKGVCVLDPHGEVEKLLDYVPRERIGDVIYFNAGDTTNPIAFNPLHNIAPEHRHIVASSLIATFKKMYSEFWGPRLEYTLNLSILTLLSYPTATLLDIQPLLTVKDFRDVVLQHVNDTAIRSFWFNEYDKYTPALRMEAISPILNKVGIFAVNPILKSIVGQQGSINIQQIADEGKILLCNFSKGSLGEEVSSLLGSMVLTAVEYAMLRRSNTPESNRKPFYLYVDEMHSYVTTAFISMLAEARKFGLSLFLTHQYLDQLNEKILTAIIGNVGTIICFQLGAADAQVMAKEFCPIFSAIDFINLSKYSMYLKLMIDGASSKPFSATTSPLQIQTLNDALKIKQTNQFSSHSTMKENLNKQEKSKIKHFVVPTLFD